MPLTDTARPDIYPLSLHDALPIYATGPPEQLGSGNAVPATDPASFLGTFAPARSTGQFSGAELGFSFSSKRGASSDRKSTRLNSSHVAISYAVFCLKKKKPLRGQSPIQQQNRHSNEYTKTPYIIQQTQPLIHINNINHISQDSIITIIRLRGFIHST